MAGKGSEAKSRVIRAGQAGLHNLAGTVAKFETPGFVTWHR